MAQRPKPAQVTHAKMARLMALDGDDLTVISAHVQDAVTQAARFEYDAKSKSFAFDMNRFVWEQAAPKTWWPFGSQGSEAGERRNAVLHFARVEGVETQGLTLGSTDTLSLLSVGFMPGEDPSGTIELTFAGEAAVRLRVECVEAMLTDMGGAWAAVARPSHGL
ncbi:MAG: DUF2948 family protein [Pseudomonadota bacterium]